MHQKCQNNSRHTALHCPVLNCTILHYTALSFTSLHIIPYTALYRTVPSIVYCTLLSMSPSCRIPLNLSKMACRPWGDSSSSSCPTSLTKLTAISTLSSVGSDMVQYKGYSREYRMKKRRLGQGQETINNRLQSESCRIWAGHNVREAASQ